MEFETVEREIRLSSLLEALQADGAKYSDVETDILNQILEQLNNTKDRSAIERNLSDMMEISNLYHYAKGIKMGAHLAKLLCL